jgi:Sulfatase
MPEPRSRGLPNAPAGLAHAASSAGLAGLLVALALGLWDLVRVLRLPPHVSGPPGWLVFVAVSVGLGAVFVGGAMLVRSVLVRVLETRGMPSYVAVSLLDVLGLFTLGVVLADPRVLEGNQRVWAAGALAGLRVLLARIAESTHRRVVFASRAALAVACLLALEALQAKESFYLRYGVHLALAAAIAGILPAAAARLRTRHAVALAVACCALAAGSGLLLSTSTWARVGLFHKAKESRAWAALREPLGPRVVTEPPSAARSADLAPRSSRPLAAGSDVVLISIDGLRAERAGDLHATLAALGPHARFDHAVSPAPGTKESMAATARGRPVRALRWERAQGARGTILWRDPSPTLAHALVAAGYRAVTVPTSNVADPRIGVLSGFESIWVANYDARAHAGDRSPFTQRSVSAGQTIPLVLQVARQTQRPLCVWLHLMETHASYHLNPDTHGKIQAPFARYLQAIKETDARVAGLLREWTRIRGKRPLVAVFGDHGEEFGEHGGAYHASTVYAEQTRVAFVLAGQGVPAGRFPQPVATSSLPATLLELLGIAVPASMTEPSLVPALQRERAWPKLAVSAMYTAFGTLVTAYAGARYRYLHDPAHDIELLFDSRTDPLDKHDIAHENPAALAELRRLARTWDAASR